MDLSQYRPELKEYPEIDIPRKDRAELGARLATKKALPPIRQVPFTSITPTPEAVKQAYINAAKAAAYSDDKIRLRFARNVSKAEERQLSNALAKRDQMAGAHLRKMGHRQEKFAGQRLKNFARAIGVGPDQFRVLR